MSVLLAAKGLAAAQTACFGLQNFWISVAGRLFFKMIKNDQELEFSSIRMNFFHENEIIQKGRCPSFILTFF